MSTQLSKSYSCRPGFFNHGTCKYMLYRVAAEQVQHMCRDEHVGVLAIIIYKNTAADLKLTQCHRIACAFVGASLSNLF